MHNYDISRTGVQSMKLGTLNSNISKSLSNVERIHYNLSELEKKYLQIKFIEKQILHAYSVKSQLGF